MLTKIQYIKQLNDRGMHYFSNTDTVFNPILDKEITIEHMAKLENIQLTSLPKKQKINQVASKPYIDDTSGTLVNFFSLF